VDYLGGGFYRAQILTYHPRFRFNQPSEGTINVISDYGEQAYKIFSSTSDHSILTVEQEHLYENKPGQGTVKKVRVNLNRVNISKAVDLIYRKEFNPNLAWEIVDALGDPMLSFKGPVGELLNPAEK